MNKDLLLANRQWILGGVIVFLSLLVYQKYFLGPVFGRANRLGKEAGEIRRNLKAAQATLSKLPQLESDMGKLRERTKELAVRFPSKAELPELLEHLSAVAEKSEVQIVEISPTRVIQEDKKEPSSAIYEVLPIDLTARSGYHELGAFINQLENSERIFSVKNIEIKADPSDPKRHHVALVVETFVREKNTP